jgi:hypothetical protein
MSEHDGSPLPTLRELTALHQEIFDVKRIRGLSLEQKIRLDPFCKVLFELLWSPTEIQMTKDNSGQILMFPTFQFQSVLRAKFSRLKVTTAIGRIQTVTACFKPFSFLSLNSRVVKSKSAIIPLVGIDLNLPWSRCRFEAQAPDTKKFTTMDFSLVLGTMKRAAGFQCLLRAGMPPGLAFLYHRQWKETIASISIARDRIVSMGFFLRKKICEGWKGAVSFKMDQFLNSMVEVGWKANIGKYIIHSCVNSNMEVKSLFVIGVTPTFDFMVSGHLDHKAHAYRFGLSLSWCPESKKKK